MSTSGGPSLANIKDPNIHGNRNYWTRYDWPEAGDEWSKPWGGSDALWFSGILPRLHPFLPAGHVLEIAPGFGRVTNHLRRYCRKLTIVDLVPKCIDACRERFKDDTHIAYVVNDGRSLEAVADNSVDLCVSWDSLVHVEHETVREYLRQLRTKLRPGGVGFIHHSNLGVHAADLKGDEGPHILGGRRPSMTAEKFRNDCKEFGLRCLSQEIVPWTGAGLWLDSFSLFMRDEANANLDPIVEFRHDWGSEVANSARLARLYRKPSEVG